MDIPVRLGEVHDVDAASAALVPPSRDVCGGEIDLRSRATLLISSGMAKISARLRDWLPSLFIEVNTYFHSVKSVLTTCVYLRKVNVPDHRA